MTEQIVKAVGLLQVIERVRPAHPPCHRKAAIGQMLEEDAIGHEPGHGYDLEARGGAQLTIQCGERRDTVRRQFQSGEPCEECVAYTAFEQGSLTGIQMRPNGMIDIAVTVQRLVDREIVPCDEARIELLF